MHSPTRVRRSRRATRLIVAAAIAAGTVLASAAPAGAVGTPHAAAPAQPVRLVGVSDEFTVLGSFQGAPVQMYTASHLDFDGPLGPFKGYSLSPIPLDLAGGPVDDYTPVPWAAAPGAVTGLGRATWAIRHAGNAAPAAVQAAVWTLAVPGQFTMDTSPGQNDPPVLADYQRLVSGAATATAAEPAVPLLTLGNAFPGVAGGLVGPFTVTASGTVTVALAAGAPAGTRVVDAAGHPVSTVPDGAKVYVRVPATLPTGSVQLTARLVDDASGLLLDPDDNPYALVDGGLRATAAATARWRAAPAPSSGVRPTNLTQQSTPGAAVEGRREGRAGSASGGTLPRTGPSESAAVAVALGLGTVLGGLLLVVAARRRGAHR